MKLFNKPSDKYTEEEYNEMRRKVQSLNLTKQEERQLIWSALKTLLPAVIMTVIGVWAVIIIIYLLLIK